MNDAASATAAAPEAQACAAPLFARLSELGIRTETRWHAAVFTVEESRHLRGAIPGAHTKNLFLKDKKGRLFLLVCGEDAVVDLKRVHHLIGASGRVSFAGEAVMEERLGVAPGSVTVFAAMNDRDGAVTIVLDRTLLASATLNAHPLTNEATTSIALADLLTFLAASGHRPFVVDVSDETAQRFDNGQVP